MDFERERFIEHLVDSRGLSRDQLSQVLRLTSESDDSLVPTLRKLGVLSETQLVDSLVDCFGLERFEPGSLQAANQSYALAARFLRAQSVCVAARGDTQCAVLADPLNQYALDGIRFAVGGSVAPIVATESQIRDLLDQEFGPVAEVMESTAIEGPAADGDLDGLRDLASDAPIVRIVQRLISEAVDRKASDIHLEPTESALSVRYRVDGVLREVERLSAPMRQPVASRLKILAGLNIAERRLPQDGRIRLTVQGKETDFRVATSPTVHGESVVLRILDRQEVALDFTALGIDEASIAIIRRVLARPYGLVLSTGPTGSGKTTTLYTALRELNTADRKILTVEDPVEYTLSGIQQTQVRPQIGYTFANALRSFLRQDPDVLMVGEIRDRETAEIAIQAALTGHLLLSTLHTNSAAAAITRLLDMGVDDYLLTSTINLIIGQRLVRRLCARCRAPGALPTALAQRLGLSHDGGELVYHATGCAQCQGSGYQGRTSILELLELTEPLQSLVLSKADAGALERAAIDHGMRTMLQDGMQKVLAGVTTLDEVLRVTRAAST